jgi:hypothetical protein
VTFKTTSITVRAWFFVLANRCALCDARLLNVCHAFGMDFRV